MQIAAAVLAGGESKRMGRDKALIPFAGSCLLEIAARACMDAQLTVSVIGRDRPGGWTLPAVVFVRDIVSAVGPLGGIVTALSVLPAEFDGLLALACDMPLLRHECVRWIVSCEENHARADGLVAVDESDRLHPLFAIYHRRCLERARDRLATGRRSVHGLIEDGDFGHVLAPPHISAQLVCVNTQAELDKISSQCELGSDEFRPS